MFVTKHVKKLLNSFRKINVEPHFCIVCDSPCFNRDLCQKCASRLPWVTHLPTLKSVYVEEIQSVFSHEDPVANWIHQFKYRNRLQLATLFAHLMLEHLYLSTNVEQIITVPLHHKRIKERGYNQADLIAEMIAKETGIDYQKDYLIRQKYTQSQVGLKPHQRQKNIHNCFQVDKKVVFDAHQILLIDDVYTTGATLNEAAKTIKQRCPNIEIIAWTVARAM